MCGFLRIPLGRKLGYRDQLARVFVAMTIPPHPGYPYSWSKPELAQIAASQILAKFLELPPR